MHRVFWADTGVKIVEWNETNCSFDETEYVKQAYEQRSWAHVSDYYRLKRLYEYGGIIWIRMFR